MGLRERGFGCGGVLWDLQRLEGCLGHPLLQSLRASQTNGFHCREVSGSRLTAVLAERSAASSI